MKQIIRQFVKYLAKFRSMGIRTIITAVLFAAFLGTLGLSILGINRPQLPVLSGVFLLAAVLSFAGQYTFASWLSVASAQVVLSYFMFINNGIRDTALIGLIAVLIAAGLLAGKRGTILVGSLIFMEILVLGYLESRGVVTNQFSPQNRPADYTVLLLSISMITLIQWLVINRLDNNIQKAHQELEDRKRAEDLLRAAEIRYRNLVERIPLVVYISEPGKAGVWKYVSNPITKLTGYTPDEWISNPELWFSRIHPEDRDHVARTETDAISNGTMPKMEYRLLTRDEREIWIYDESLFVLDDENRMFVQGFLLDITHRKRAEEQLKKRIAELQAVHGISETLIQKSDLQKLIFETGEQIRLAFNANNVLISIHDPATNLIHFAYDYEDGVYRNDVPIPYGAGMTTRIMKMKRPLRIDKDWHETVTKMNAIITNKIPVQSSFHAPIMENDRVIGLISLENNEREYAFKEIDTRPILTIAANLAVAIEKTRLQETLGREIEIQERLIRELEMKNEELERFTYTASHDLKSPLITIRGFLGYLELDARSGNLERLTVDIQRISDATEKMHRLLSELLELSRVGRVSNEKQKVAFDTLIAEALKRVEGRLKEKGITVQYGNGFPVVYVDAERIIEVIQNLVDNAAKFTIPGREAKIEIGHLIQNNKPVFYVRDNGIGIKKQFHQRIFGLFDKLDPASEGTGVGLALVKRIIEVHGGQIWLESGEGVGTSFYFTLGDKGEV